VTRVRNSNHRDRPWFRRIPLHRVGAFVALSCLIACAQPQSPRSDKAALPVRTLPSGKQISLIKVNQEEAKSGDVTLFVDYVTRLPIRNYLALAIEADEVWSTFRQAAEQSRVRTVMITTHEKPAGGASSSFAFTLGNDGEWLKPEVRTLRSGKKIVVISVRKDGGDLFVDYVTSLPIKDLCGLSPEVDEVWSEYRRTAEDAGVGKVFICPNTAPVGGGDVSFSFTRGENGEWSRRGTCPGDAPDVFPSRHK
jgi:hypothetical protein